MGPPDYVLQGCEANTRFENAAAQAKQPLAGGERNAHQRPSTVWPSTCEEPSCAFQVSQEIGKYPVNGRRLIYLRLRADVASVRPAAAICKELVSNRQRRAGDKEEGAECVAPDSSQLLLVSNFRMSMT